jgi:hypothetical protein
MAKPAPEERRRQAVQDRCTRSVLNQVRAPGDPDLPQDEPKISAVAEPRPRLLLLTLRANPVGGGQR